METPENADPLVSICIPVYNAAITIGRTIESVIGQTYTNIEIIVVDNLSTDATLSRVREYKDPRIRIIENPVHFCCAEYNWNTCFAHTRGEFIALFHADDRYAPEIIAQQVAVFKKFPLVGAVFTQGEMIDEDDKVTGIFRLPPTITGNTPYTYCDLLPVILKHGNFLLCPSAMIRSTIYKTMTPFRYDQFGSASDLDMWLRIAKTVPVLIIDKKFLKYRLSRTQWSYILKSRTTEADGFRVLDHHVSENGNLCNLSGDTLAIYALRRMEDQIFCAMNFLRNRNFSGFRHHVNHMAWKKYIRVILTNPCRSIHFLIRGIFKVLKNVKTVISF